MICSYGCGLESIKQFKNGKWCCAKRSDQCPAIIKKRIATRQQNGLPWFSSEAKLKIGRSSKNRVVSASTCAKISMALKGKKMPPRSEEHCKNLSKSHMGKIPWNKGLTAEDPRVAAYAKKQTGQKRKGNYVSSDKWKGAGNYWYGKSRSKELSPRYNGEKFNNEFRDYRNKVSWLSEQIYIQNKAMINPNNKDRTLSGIKGGHQLDHVYPILEGFKNQIPPELIADVSNLQLLSWEDNLSKSNKIRIIPDIIQQYLKENYEK